MLGARRQSRENLTRLKVGRDRIKYPGNCGIPTADLIEVKLFLNSVISTLDARFTTLNIKNFYLNASMARYKDIQLKLNNFP